MKKKIALLLALLLIASTAFATNQVTLKKSDRISKQITLLKEYIQTASKANQKKWREELAKMLEEWEEAKATPQPSKPTEKPDDISKVLFRTAEKGIDIVQFAQVAVLRAQQIGATPFDIGPSVSYVVGNFGRHANVEHWMLTFEDDLLVIENASGFFSVYHDDMEKTKEELIALMPGLSAFEHPTLDNDFTVMLKGYAIQQTNNRFSEAMKGFSFSSISEPGQRAFLYYAGDYRVSIGNNNMPETPNTYVLEVTLRK